MSLLIDALKRAEAAKKAAEQEGIAPAQKLDLELQPLDLPPRASESTPAQAPANLEAEAAQPEILGFDEKFFEPERPTSVFGAINGQTKTVPPAPSAAQPSKAMASPSPATKIKVTPPSTGPSGQAAAQNLFAAKQAADGKRNFIIGISVFTLLAVSGIGVYFWMQISPPASARMLPASLPSFNAKPSAPIVAAPPATPITPPPNAQTNNAAVTSSEKFEPPLSAQITTNVRPAPEVEKKVVDLPIRITRAKPQINANVARGWELIQLGRIDAAQTAYEQALAAEPNNEDALHGLAAIALQKNQPARAEELYRTALNSNPKDSVAYAALISLAGQTNAGASESRLKSMIAEQPQAAAPHYALGNLYAGQKLWREAQQAYFTAYTAEPDNPDLAFNLAVSLDQLHQYKLAAQYYSQALALATKRPASFNQAQANERLRNLQP